MHDRYGQRVKFLPPVTHSQQPSAFAAAIVFSCWQSTAATNVKPLDSLDALVRLLNTGFWVAPDRECIQSFLNWLKGLAMYELVYSDADQAAALIRQIVDREP